MSTLYIIRCNKGVCLQTLLAVVTCTFLDIYPHDSLVMECVSHLLLSKDWEYLSSLHDTRVAFTEVESLYFEPFKYIELGVAVV